MYMENNTWDTTDNVFKGACKALKDIDFVIQKWELHVDFSQIGAELPND